MSTPSIETFDPIKKATWKEGESVPYKAFADLLDKIDPITERTIIATTPGDLLPAIYLCYNKVCPDYKGIELGIGDSLIIKAIQEATGRGKEQMKSLYKETGDLGEIAMKSKSTQRLLFAPKPLTIRSIFNDFKAIASLEGTKSQDKKIGIIKRLMVASTGSEIKYIVRGLQGRLRVGLAEQTILVSLAHAIILTPCYIIEGQPRILDRTTVASYAKLNDEMKDAENIIKQVYSECPDFDMIIPALINNPLSKLHDICHLLPGIPVVPMLAKPTKGITEVLDRFQGLDFTCEYKYDGERAQIHKLPSGEIKIFSRNSEDTSQKFPDLIQTLKEVIPESVHTCILDSECVAWNREEGKMLPFQVLATRGKKAVNKEDVKVNVIIFCFDILYLNGECIIEKTLQDRQELLHNTIHEKEGRFMYATHMAATDTEQIQSFLQESIDHGCEGLMLKTLTENAEYEPSRRSLNWLKLKKDYISTTGDSFDLVPIAGWYGKGKRKGTIGAFLLACYDVDNEQFQSVCKLGTGFSDDNLKEFSTFFNDHIVQSKPVDYNVDTTIVPDVWFEVVQTWEVRAADLSISPVHRGAFNQIESGKGIGLRFPRFIRVREDKKPESCTDANQIAEFYNNQSILHL
ncbi:hypothetical protein WA158_001850 [Blastocystis sp. Blastoise]